MPSTGLAPRGHWVSVCQSWVWLPESSSANVMGGDSCDLCPKSRHMGLSKSCGAVKARSGLLIHKLSNPGRRVGGGGQNSRPLCPKT